MRRVRALLIGLVALGAACAERNGATGQGTERADADTLRLNGRVAVANPAVRLDGRPDLPLHLIRLPAGFAIELYADTVPGARSMALSPAGILYVGTRDEGRVYAIVDADRDLHADRVVVIAQGLASPNGVAWRNGALYVAEIQRILRYDDIDHRLDDPPRPVVVRDDFPTERHHGWKFIAFGPDGWLYVPVGMPCNVCLPPDSIFGTITRMTFDGARREIYARGVRNSVGFDWHPETGVLWFTDNGRDRMGDDVPPDELNRALGPGLHFGYPFCHAGEIPDPEFGDTQSCAQFVSPARKLGPHVAALGVEFYQGPMFPAEYHGQIMIAEHGSWDRTVPIGYRLTHVTLDGDRAASYDVFAEGWLQGSEAWGRPVDVETLPDGSLLVSDDEAGAIYRIRYDGD
jgi:glucose/arabinose dehydrogenase